MKRGREEENGAEQRGERTRKKRAVECDENTDIGGGTEEGNMLDFVQTKVRSAWDWVFGGAKKKRDDF